MTNLVDRMPRYFLNINGVRRINLICLAPAGVSGGLAVLPIAICRTLAQINVHAGTVAPLTRNVQRGPSLGVNSCLGAPVWEIGLPDNVDHAPCVIGLTPGHLAADGLAYLRVRTVAAHNILGTNDALVAFSVFYRDSNWVLPFFAYLA